MTAAYAQVEGSYIFSVLITVSVWLKFNLTTNKGVPMLRALASRTFAGKSTAGKRILVESEPGSIPNASRFLSTDFDSWGADMRADPAVEDWVSRPGNWRHPGDGYACAACHPQEHFLRSSDCRHAKWADAYACSKFFNRHSAGGEYGRRLHAKQSAIPGEWSIGSRCVSEFGHSQGDRSSSGYIRADQA